MKKVKLYHKQLSAFYRNEYTRVCIRRMQSMPDAIYFNTLAVSTPLARIPIHHVDQLLFVNFSIFFLNFKG